VSKSDPIILVRTVRVRLTSGLRTYIIIIILTTGQAVSSARSVMYNMPTLSVVMYIIYSNHGISSRRRRVRRGYMICAYYILYTEEVHIIILLCCRAYCGGARGIPAPEKSISRQRKQTRKRIMKSLHNTTTE